MIIAVEDKSSTNTKEKGIGRIRLKRIDDASSDSLISFIHAHVSTNSIIRTDGWIGYEPLKKNGYKHIIDFFGGF